MKFPFVLLLFLPGLLTVVKTPSASASTSFSSSLLNLASKSEDDLDIDSRQIHHHRLIIQETQQQEQQSNPKREECKVKNLKQHQRMAMAKLDAHRCLIRDTVVALKAPDDVIVEFITPSHVVVPRCTGKQE
jgi:hypothetical protein